MAKSWKYSLNVGPTKGLIVEADGSTVAEVVNRVRSGSRFEADVRLMTSAPAMLEALEQVRAWLLSGIGVEVDYPVQWIDAAISQARAGSLGDVPQAALSTKSIPGMIYDPEPVAAGDVDSPAQAQAVRSSKLRGPKWLHGFVRGEAGEPVEVEAFAVCRECNSFHQFKVGAWHYCASHKP